jgi:hypothetical protein
MSVQDISPKAVPVDDTEVDESAALLYGEQRRYDGQGNDQDEENSISSATVTEAEPTTKDVVTPSKVSPTAVVLVLVVGELFITVNSTTGTNEKRCIHCADGWKLRSCDPCQDRV